MAQTSQSGIGMSQKILYLGALDKGFVQGAKLAGIRRYAAARRWEVVPVPKAQSIPSRIPVRKRFRMSMRQWRRQNSRLGL